MRHDEDEGHSKEGDGVVPAEGRREPVPVLREPRHALSGRGAVGRALQVGQPQERLVKLVLRCNHTQHTSSDQLHRKGPAEPRRPSKMWRSEVLRVTGQGAYLGGQVGESTV